MFGNVYRKYILRAVRSRDLVIWTLLFPILLATLFHFAFGALEDEGSFEAIPVAVVRDEALDKESYLKNMLEALGTAEEPMLKLHWVSGIDEADSLLKEDEVEGYLAMEENAPKLYVKENGIAQTLLKSVLDRYLQTRDTVMKIIEKNPVAALGMAQKASDGIWDSSEGLIGELSLSEKKPSATANYYYALLAMICLYGGFHGLVVVEGLQADLSPQGTRNTLSPANRYTLFGASFLGALTIQFLCVTVSLCYMQFVLGVDFGNQFGYALGAVLAGSMTGISFGSLVGLPVKWKGGVKVGVMVGVSMFCCFLAGLMIGGINYLVEEHAPFLSMINPAARIADTFYCLYYYEDHIRYFRNMGILLLMSVVFLGICMTFTRREQYESI